MNEFTPLVRPSQSQVSIDSRAKECPSEGFNYPVFRQLNKQARIYLSEPLDTNPLISYHLFAVANSKGWFAAVQKASSGFGLIFSTLEDLPSRFSAAKEDDNALFSPKRIIPLQCNANIIAFACGDTRLLVGLENGYVEVYDTASLFTQGSNSIQHLKATQIQASPLRQILPNPGDEPNLVDLVAVVGDGKVALLNMQLELQGGWMATDLMTQPISVAWSPKGKHIAVGLQTGDILTYSLTNKSTPHKHIPPTADAILVSLNWPGPGHTFRTTYAAQGESHPKQHIIVLDTKSSTATYFAPDHPFPSYDRTVQGAYSLTLPRWDQDSASSEESKSLTLVGDISSVDLEVIGNVANQWHRQSQENPLSLPLNKEMDDTMLLSLEVDLTDSTVSVPIIYAYLNDGSLQGWHAEHSKPYVGMITPNALASTSQISSQSQESRDADMSAESSTQPPPPTNAFGQAGFGQTPSAFGGQQASAFGNTGFGQTQSSSTFSQPASAFGQPSNFGAFGQTQTNSGATSAFGSAKPTAGFGAFGGASSGAFGSSTPNAFSGFSSSTTNAFNQGSFGAPVNANPDSLSPSHSPNMTREASMSDSTPGLGGFGGFGLGSATPSESKVNSMFGSIEPPATANATDSTSTFAGSSGIVKPASGFGAFGGFKTGGSFDSNNKPAATVNAFSSPPPQSAATSSAFGQPSSFGQPSFGSTTAFGKPSLPQPAFGKPSLGPAATAPTSGGFGAFASTPTTFGSAAQAQKTSVFGSTESKPATSGGFGAFASTTPTTFGSAVSAPSTSKSKPAGGFGAFASNAPTTFGSALAAKPTQEAASSQVSSSSEGGFGAFASTTPSVFGSAAGHSSATSGASTPSAGAVPRTSVFGTSFGVSTSPAATTTPFGTPAKSPFGSASPFGGDASPEEAHKPKPAFALSPPSSPEPSNTSSIFGNSTTPAASPTPNSGGAFGNIQVTPSAFKPATGFGAFGSSTETPKSSPFFKKSDETPPPISAFAPINASTSRTPGSASTTPAFGTPSALGGVKSAFAPISPASPTPASSGGGFSAFSSSSGGFSAFSGPKKSFAELLKTGDNETKDPVKPSTSAPSTPSKGKDKEEVQPTRVPVFETAKTDGVNTSLKEKGKARVVEQEDEGASKSPEGQEKKLAPISDEPSYGSISVSSTGSSFVEIDADADADQSKDTDGESSDEDAHHDDQSDFLTDEESLEDGEVESDEEDEDSLPEDDVEDGEDEVSHLEPSTVPLPLSRSPSATPQPEVPRIEVSPSPPAETTSASSPVREPSTTPPGTPVKEAKPLFGAGPGSSSSSATQATPSPFGIGLGRPSTRPTRSSPLANAVVSGDEGDEATLTPRLPPAVSPKPVFGALPVVGDIKRESSPLDDGQPPGAKRPKTPPLLSKIPSMPSPSMTPPSLPTSLTFNKKSPSPDISSSIPGTSASLPFSFARPASTPPPMGSLFGKGPEPAAAPMAKPDLIRTATAPPPAPQTSLFGTKPANVFSMPAFSLGNPTSSTAGTPSAFGAPPLSVFPSNPGFGKPAIAPASLPQASSGFFGAPKQAPGAPAPSMFGGQAPASVQRSTPVSPLPVTKPTPAPPVKTPEEILEEGMQKECANLVNTVNNDLQDLSRTATTGRQAVANSNISQGGSKLKADLGNQSKWGMGDLRQFNQLLVQYQSDLELLCSYRDEKKQFLRDIQSNLLKAGTRREEVARFNKAKDDKEFAKMLKARTLGPEHSETQTQLRKSIRTIRDRVQKLEKHLQDDKKRLAQSQSCRPTIKAPTLDTINRTYRNIDIAIEQQADEVNRLATRIAKINMADVGASLVPRDARLPDASGPRRPYNVTPTVAVTTAAALNAERASQRLKKSLLAVRKEPLFNNKAAAAPIAPVAFKTPQKLSSGPASGFDSLSGSLFSEPVDPGSVLDPNEWQLPEDKFDPTASPLHSGGRREGTRPKKHTGSAQLKKTTNVASPSAAIVDVAPISFDWGPLPSFNPPVAAKGLPKAFVPISNTPTSMTAVASPTLGNSPATAVPANLPKGFVPFSIASSPSAPASASPSPSAAPTMNLPQSFSFARPAAASTGFTPTPPTNAPKGFFSFSNSPSTTPK